MHFTFILFCILASEKKVINKLNQIPDWTYRALYWNTVPNLYTLVIAFKLFVWYENKMHQKRCFLTSFKNCCLLAKNGNSQSTNYFFMRCRSKQSNNCNKIHAEFFCFLLSFDDIEWQVWIQFFLLFEKCDKNRKMWKSFYFTFWSQSQSQSLLQLFLTIFIWKVHWMNDQHP